MSRDSYRSSPAADDEQRRFIEQALEGLSAGTDIIDADVAERAAKREKDRRLRLEEEGDAIAPARAPSADNLFGLLTPGGIDPPVQPERGLGRQLGVRPRSHAALEETAESPGVAAALGMGEPVPVSRVLTGLANMAAGGTYAGGQEEVDRLEAESPWSSAGGVVAGSLPLLAAGPMVSESVIARLGGAATPEAVSAAVARGVSPLSRIGAAGLEAMLAAGTNQLARGEIPGIETMLSGGLGAGLASIPAVVGHVAQRAQPRTTENPSGGLVDSLEDRARHLRVRAGGGRTLPVQRAIASMGETADGTADAARWLDESGGSPRYSMHSVDDTREVAERVRGRAGRTLNRVFGRMAEADADDVARFASESDDVAARDAQRSRFRSAIEADDPTMLSDVTPDGDIVRNRDLEDPLILDRVRRHREPMHAEIREAGSAQAGGHNVRMNEDRLAAMERGDVTDAFGILPREGLEAFHQQNVVQPANAARRARTPTGGPRVPTEDLPLLPPDTPEQLAAYEAGEAARRARGQGMARTARPEGWRPPSFTEGPASSMAAPDERSFAMVDELLPAIDAPRPPGTVDLEPLLLELAGGSARAAELPSGEGLQGALDSAARRYGQTGGRMPFGRPRAPGQMGGGTGAQGQVELLDQDIYRTVRGDQPLGRPGATDLDMRAERGLLRRAQQDAVNTVDPALGAEYADARRDYQFGNAFANLGDDDALREAANRVFSQSDYLAVPGDAGVGTRLLYMLANRFARGREASGSAAVLEHLSDALQSGRLQSAGGLASAAVPRSGRIADSLVRPGVAAQPPPERQTTDSEVDYLLQGNPEIEVEDEEARDVSDEELEALLAEEAGQ